MSEEKDQMQDKEAMEDVEQPETVEASSESSGSDDQLKDQLAVLNDKYLRLSAEFDNYRKRTLKEKAELLKSAGEDVLSRILPVVDNLERALDSMEKTDDVESLREGIRLIYQSFKDFLAQNGVQEIPCIHNDFNTDEQEAITKIPAPTKELQGKVIDCVQKGYTLNGKVIRFAKVVVGE